MGKINEFCAGIDVGKRFLLCCALTGAAQEEPRSQTRRFDATVQDLVHLRDWLSSKNITHVAMIVPTATSLIEILAQIIGRIAANMST